MGGGSYSYRNAVQRSVSTGVASHSVAVNSGLADDSYVSKDIGDVFLRDSVHSEMKSVGIGIREARDSEEHPNSLAIIIALDVTGSMGQVPHQLVSEGFPKLMDKILQAGVEDPQVMFLAIGDHECDSTPLQVGQFESSDELLDKWLTNIYLEGGGGGNAGESYPLAWYFAANHTAIDCFEKRGKKGIIFTIGDEPPLMQFPQDALKQIMGEGAQTSDEVAKKLFEKASETYEVFHIHIRETYRGSRPDSPEAWKSLIGKDRLLMSQHHDDVAGIIADKILEIQGKTPAPVEEKSEEKSGSDVEMM